MEYLSKQRYDEIAAELKHLIHEVYPKVKEDLAEASAQGDRSDNAGYREARRMQGKTISRIRFLQKVLEHSRVIDPDSLPKDRVCLLSRVEFTNLATNTRMRFEIVSPHEMDLEAGKISLKSPIGAALMGKRVGEIAEAQVPSGILRLRIDSINWAEKRAVDFETANECPFRLFEGAGKSQKLIHQRAGKAGVPEIVRMQEVCFGIMEVYGLGI